MAVLWSVLQTVLILLVTDFRKHSYHTLGKKQVIQRAFHCLKFSFFNSNTSVTIEHVIDEQNKLNLYPPPHVQQLLHM